MADRKFSWGVQVAVPVVAALVGAGIGLAGGVILTDRQIDASERQVADQIDAAERQVADQIDAARIGRVQEAKADTYGTFIAAVDRHLSSLGGEEQEIRDADREVFAALSVVQLQGSDSAGTRAAEIASIARLLTNAGVLEAQSGRRSADFEKHFFKQQRKLTDFTIRVRREVRGG